MKNIEGKLITSLKKGLCVPSSVKLARELKEPTSTMHFNIKKLEREGKILGYKPIMNYKKIEKGFCGFALVKLDKEIYRNTKLALKEAERIAKHESVESVDLITGNFELLVKIRAKDHDDYFTKTGEILSSEHIEKVNTLVSIKQIKSEHTNLPQT